MKAVQKVEFVRIEDLKPYALNARKHPKKQIEVLAEAIKKFGFVVPIVVDKDNNIIAGHGRYEALKKLKYDKVPVVRAEWLSEKEVQALRILDNRIHDMSGWDYDMLKVDLSTLDEEFKLSFDFSWAERQKVYTLKVERPIYEPKGIAVSPQNCYDDTRYRELLQEIEQLEADEDMKQLLRLAATRFIVFKFDLLAELYAQLDSEHIARMFERLALVIPDFNHAIEDGFVELNARLKRLYEQQHGKEVEA